MSYADVNGLHLYYEEHGAGTPLVLLHGGMLTVDLNFATLIPTLARDHRVVAVELQGHGRTADIDREITPAHSAGDVVALLDHLGVDRAHVLGHSMGGAVALEMAVNHPDRLLSAIGCSVTVRAAGMHEDFVDPARMAVSDRMPTADDMAAMRDAYQRLAPHPERFDAFLATLSSSDADLRGWSDAQLAAVTTPVLIVLGDRDFMTVAHGEEMLRLIPGARLAVLPGTTHLQVTRRADLLLPILAAFLREVDGAGDRR